MIPLWEMSVDDQHRQQSGPGTEGLPGYVIAGPGPWFTDDYDEWQIDPEAECPVTGRATPTRPQDRA